MENYGVKPDSEYLKNLTHMVELAEEISASIKSNRDRVSKIKSGFVYVFTFAYAFLLVLGVLYVSTNDSGLFGGEFFLLSLLFFLTFIFVVVVSYFITGMRNINELKKSIDLDLYLLKSLLNKIFEYRSYQGGSSSSSLSVVDEALMDLRLKRVDFDLEKK